MPNTVKKYWKAPIEGFRPQGILFDFDTGLKKPIHSDISVNQKYYLIIHDRYINAYGKNILNHLIIDKQLIRQVDWRVFTICATEMSQQNIEFFIALGYWLKDKNDVVEMIPLWPPVVKTPYVIKHNWDQLYMCLRGNLLNVRESLNPEGGTLKVEDRLLYFKASLKEQQLLAIGRSTVLSYLYLLKRNNLEQFSKIKEKIQIYEGIEKNDDKLLTEEIYDKLPYKKQICYYSGFDGKIRVYKNQKVFKEIDIKSNGEAATKLPPEWIDFGVQFKFYIGNDLVRTLAFEKPEQYSEELLYQQLINCQGKTVPCSHRYGGLIKGHSRQIRNWLYQQIKSGKIKKQALKILLKSRDKR